ncbi:DNA gyrase inhibitor YacG [Stappia sp. TSB10GB4]|uniref:DNA gyrase inhibitor YacG n=1 Tax=Stappia sp. TSB10GB4 TaxID=2003584 RepID=UPI001644461E|nr:DNA gyrase inhibitor YacG [Stappia sp. TSB10GB4]
MTGDRHGGERHGGGSREDDWQRRARPCPVCGKLSVERFHPFCSSRCADVDLNRWLSGSYSVPVVELEPEDLAALEAMQDTGESGK